MHAGAEARDSLNAQTISACIDTPRPLRPHRTQAAPQTGSSTDVMLEEGETATYTGAMRIFIGEPAVEASGTLMITTSRVVWICLLYTSPSPRDS